MSPPSAKEYDNDAYVTKLLAEDARKASIRYSSLGISGMGGAKRPSGPGSLKPNTKFLNNLVRDANSHNAALKKKEELEAKIRLRKIRDEDVRPEKQRTGRDQSDPGDDRRRRKRRRTYDEDNVEDKKDREQSRNKSSTYSGKEFKSSRKSRARSRSPSPDESQHLHRHRRHHHAHGSNRDGTEERKHSNQKRRDTESMSSSTEVGRHRLSSHNTSNSKLSYDSRASHEPRSSVPHSKAPKTMDEEDQSSSDPLEDLIGPLPAASTTSKMDSHFSPTYNPSKDTSPPDDDDGVDLDSLESDIQFQSALSAYRNRQSYKSRQASRLREAGFGEDDVRRWEDSITDHGGYQQQQNHHKNPYTKNAAGIREQVKGRPRQQLPDFRDVNEVKWAKKGEAKEWDVGKIDLDK